MTRLGGPRIGSRHPSRLTQAYFVGGPRDGQTRTMPTDGSAQPVATLRLVEYEVNGRRPVFAFHTYLRSESHELGRPVWRYDYIDPNPDPEEEADQP